jgi:hypothetical protein
MLAAPPGTNDLLLRPMECILSALERAHPLRLERKRKDFRRDLDEGNQLNLRLELLVASRLTTCAIPFEFGDAAQPDLRCWPAEDHTVSLELTTRKRDGHRDLCDKLEEALADLAVLVTVHIPTRQLHISASDCQAVCARVRAAVEASAESQCQVPLPEISGTALCTFADPTSHSRVTLENASELTEHFNSVEQELRNVVEWKRDQAERGGFDPMTILVVDASRLGQSWLRPPKMWAGALARLSLDWDRIPFAGVLVAFSSLDSLSVSGYYQPRPDITDAQVAAIDPVLRALDFTPDHGAS